MQNRAPHQPAPPALKPAPPPRLACHFSGRLPWPRGGLGVKWRLQAIGFDFFYKWPGMSDEAFESYQDWRRRRLDPGAPELGPKQACEFLLHAIAEGDDRMVIRIMEESPQWGADEETPNDERHPVVACLALGQKRCLEAFLRHTDCAAWTLSGARSLAHFAVELDAAWAIEPLLREGCNIHQMDACGMSAASWARVFDNQEAIGAFKTHCEDNGWDYRNASAVYEPALSGALKAYFQSLLAEGSGRAGRKSHDAATPDFFKTRCAWLKRAGLDPDASPLIPQIACECQFASSLSEAFLPAFTEACRLASELGADVEARVSLGAARSLSALDIAASCLHAGAFEALEKLGAQRPEEPLAEIAWRQILGGGAASLLAPVRSPERLECLARFCEEADFWPPFAPSREAVADFFKAAPTSKRKEQARLLDAFELWLSTGAGRQAPRAPSVRI